MEISKVYEIISKVFKEFDGEVHEHESKYLNPRPEPSVVAGDDVVDDACSVVDESPFSEQWKGDRGKKRPRPTTFDDEIDQFDEYNTLEGLIELGPKKLDEGLDALGLNSEGTVLQKAARLLLAKNTERAFIEAKARKLCDVLEETVEKSLAMADCTLGLEIEGDEDVEEYVCKICGDYIYKGRLAFKRHFGEERHEYGLNRLGIPNSLIFNEITENDEAVKLWEDIRVRVELFGWCSDESNQVYDDDDDEGEFDSPQQELQFIF